jgi:malonate transporter
MLSVFGTVLPIFALILAGWGMRRIGVLGPQATSELNRFVVYLALPALLVEIVATARWSEVWQPRFVGTFGLGTLLIFMMALLIRLRRPRHMADAAIDGLNASYANTGFMGFPLALAVFGQDMLTPTLIATILTVCVLFALALVLLEAGLQSERHPRRMAIKIATSLCKNPLLVAPVLGGLVMASGQEVPHPIESFLKLLGGAASPCALVALGLFLAESHKGDAAPERDSTALLVGLKLVAHPALTWVLGAWLFHLPTALLHTAVLMAALPTGTGPFMVAEFYRREANITSSSILVSTILSLVSITLYLNAIG